MFETKDILLYESGNGGELAVINNDIALNEQLSQQVYLCLFGGNIEADTRGDEIPTQIRNDWWGNSLLFSERKAKQFNSETERMLNENPLNSSGRLVIQRAIENDLKHFKTVADVTVSITILSSNRLSMNIKLIKPNNQQGASLQLIWDNARKQIIEAKTI